MRNKNLLEIMYVDTRNYVKMIRKTEGQPHLAVLTKNLHVLFLMIQYLCICLQSIENNPSF